MDSVMEHWQSGKDGKSAVVTSLDQASRNKGGVGRGGERWLSAHLLSAHLGLPRLNLATLAPCQAGTIISAAGVIMLLAFGCEQGSVSEVSRKCL